MVHDENERQFPKVASGPGRMQLGPRSIHDSALDSSLPPALASFGLGKISPVAHMSQEELIVTLHHEKWSLRIAAISKLAQLKEAMPVTELLTALSDAHQAVRAATIRALGQAGSRTPTSALMVTLYDPSCQVRAAAVNVLGKQTPPIPMGHLIAALQDEEETVRVAALAAFAKRGEAAPIESIILALHDPSWLVREAAALALGSLGERVPVDALLEALKDEDSTVREAAQEALNKTHPAYGNQLFSLQATHPFTTAELEPQVFRPQPADDPPVPTKPITTLVTKPMRWKKIVIRVGMAAAVLLFLLAAAFLRNHATVSPANTPTTATTFQQIQNLATMGLTRITWSPGSSSSASSAIAYMDDTGLVHVWNTDTGKYVSSYGPFPSGLAVNWLATGLSIASVRSDGAVQLTSEGNIEPTLMPTLGLIDAKPLSSWSPDGSHFAIALNSPVDSTIQICETATTSHCAISFAQTAGPVTAITWSSDSKEVAIVSKNDQTTTIALLDTDSAKSVSPSITLNNTQLVALAWSPDNQYLAYLLSDGGVRILGNGNDAPMLLTTGAATTNTAQTASWQGALAWSPDGQLLATTTPGGMIQVWDTMTNQMLTTYQEHTTLVGVTKNVDSMQISTLLWSHDGKRLASVDSNGKVLVWKTDEHQNSPQQDCVSTCDADSMLYRVRSRPNVKNQQAISLSFHIGAENGTDLGKK
jgi:HEAT repeat protein/WD40 repeat protein